MSQQIFRSELCRLTLVVTASLFWTTSAGAFQAAAPAPKPAAMLELELADIKEQILEVSKSRKALIKEIAGLDQRLDGMNISTASIDEVMKVLQTQRVSLMIELAGLDARQKAATALGTGKAEMNEANKKRLGLLKQAVELSRNEYDNVRKLAQKGYNSKQENNRAKFAALIAETELAEFEAEYSTNSQSPRIKNMLIDVTLSKAERSAQLDMVNKLLSQFNGKGRGVLSERQSKVSEEFKLLQRHKDLELETQAIQRQIRLLRQRGDN